MTASSLKPIPEFKTEQEERVFWQTHCLTEYIDLSKPVRVFLPNLQRRQEPDKLKVK